MRGKCKGAGPFGILKAARGGESDGGRMEEMQDAPVDPTLVSRQGRIIEAPVAEIVDGGVLIPLLDWSMDRNLHPVPLRFIVAIFGGHARTCNHDGNAKLNRTANTARKNPSPGIRVLFRY